MTDPQFEAGLEILQRFGNEIERLKAKLVVATAGLEKITADLQPSKRGHYPKDAAQKALHIAFDALGKIQCMDLELVTSSHVLGLTPGGKP